MRKLAERRRSLLGIRCLGRCILPGGFSRVASREGLMASPLSCQPFSLRPALIWRDVSRGTTARSYGSSFVGPISTLTLVCFVKSPFQNERVRGKAKSDVQSLSHDQGIREFRKSRITKGRSWRHLGIQKSLNYLISQFLRLSINPLLFYLFRIGFRSGGIRYLGLFRVTSLRASEPWCLARGGNRGHGAAQ